MSPTSDQLRAAEEALGINPNDRTKIERTMSTEERINRVATLLSEREAKARRDGAEKVARAVRGADVYTQDKFAIKQRRLCMDAAEKALNDLK